MSINKYTEERPWGKFERFTMNEETTVKIITVKSGEAFSLQYHTKREEFWHIISGSGFVTLGEERKEAKAGDEFTIPIGTHHRMEATEEIKFLEIAFGEFDENEIMRVTDKYGRV